MFSFALHSGDGTWKNTLSFFAFVTRPAILLASNKSFSDFEYGIYGFS
jgi:hypothetical protein